MKIVIPKGLQAISPGLRQRTRGKQNETETVPAAESDGGAALTIG